MTPDRFYENLLRATSVDRKTMDSARDKRDELGAKAVAEVSKRLGSARWIRVGALAQGTQIAPLNDVDGVIEVAMIPREWEANPHLALETVRSWLEPVIDGRFEISTHAIKITFPDEGFTADVAIGLKQAQGLLIPECPRDKPHRWIATDPERHKEQVLARNEQFESAIFTRQIRILKHLNRRWKMADPLERKPLSSFHITALALKLLTEPNSHAEWTPFFLERAALLVMQPLPDPAGVGDPIEARDPAYAAGLLADAAVKTRRALAVSEEEAEKILRDVFGDPDRLDKIVNEPSVSVGRAGALAVPAASAVRSTPLVRSHGDANR
jgi:hypothetical protein